MPGPKQCLSWSPASACFCRIYQAPVAPVSHADCGHQRASYAGARCFSRRSESISKAQLRSTPIAASGERDTPQWAAGRRYMRDVVRIPDHRRVDGIQKAGLLGEGGTQLQCTPWVVSMAIQPSRCAVARDCEGARLLIAGSGSRDSFAGLDRLPAAACWHRRARQSELAAGIGQQR